MYQTRINPRLSPVSSSTLLTGLSHWWDLLGNANDSVSGGHNMTTSEAFTGTAPSGDTNCIVFDGTGGAGLYSGEITGESRTEITIGLWFYRNSGGDYRSIWNWGSENYQYFVTNALHARVNSITNTGPATLSTNTWYCNIFSANSSGFNNYINNASYNSGSEAFDFTPMSNDFDLGDLNQANLQGKMCCCAIWDRILTSDERTEFYNGGVNLKYADL
jgi:hypothetical protein